MHVTYKIIDRSGVLLYELICALEVLISGEMCSEYEQNLKHSNYAQLMKNDVMDITVYFSNCKTFLAI